MLPQQDLPLSAAKSGFFIPAAVIGTADGGGGEGVGGGEEQEGWGEAAKCSGEWREEGE